MMPAAETSRQLMALRKRMGYLFQNGALINWLSVADNVALPLRGRVRSGFRRQGLARRDAAGGRIGLPDGPELCARVDDPPG